MKSLTRQQVRDLDSYVIEQLGVPGVVLMENAGRNAADAIADFAVGIDGKRIAIVAGSGNNGGDGFVIARHLGNRGATVTTFLIVPRDKITGDADINLEAIVNLDHDIRCVTGGDFAHFAEVLSSCDIIVDAVGGTGITGPLRDDLVAVVERINAAGKPVVAIDIPTGLDCDTGLATGKAVAAKLTVTFVARKAGFDNPDSEQYTGEVQVADIGVDAETVLELMK
ncbi:MAG: NAD(P)H-hydrate epimerase [Phycisphaerae bacterium]|nr:NAD(P)H-hydrate epimerase [Phycisphaerae bacterium]